MSESKRFRGRPARRRLFALGALSLGAVAALLGGEVAVRLFGGISEPRRHFRPGIYAADPTLGWRLLPNYQGVHLEYAYEAPTRINDLGYRGPAWSEARLQAGTRVLALGDSCTFGRGVADDETYPHQIEALLREGGLTDAAVFNAGVPGYDTVQQLAVLEELLPVVRPHVVVLAWLPNDVLERSVDQIPRLQVLDGQLVHDVERYREWRERIDHQGIHGSALYRFLRVRSKQLEGALGMERSSNWNELTLAPEALAYSTGPLRQIVERTRAHGAEPVLVLFPRKEELLPDADHAHHDHMAAVAEGLGVPCVHLPRLWRERGGLEEEYLLRDAVHLTPGGYREVARDVAPVVAKARARSQVQTER